MDPSEIRSPSRLPNQLDEGTSPELNEKERSIDSSDAEVPSVEVEEESEEPESEQLLHISFDDEIRSSSMYSLQDYEKNDDDENNSDGSSISQSSKVYEVERNLRTEQNSYYSSSDNGKGNFSENEERYAKKDEKSSENEERYPGNDGEPNYFSPAEEREHHSGKASTVTIISETNDEVFITLKAVSKKTVIQFSDIAAAADIKSKVFYTHNYGKIKGDIIITPKVPKTKTSEKSSEDGYCYSPYDSDKDKKDSFAVSNGPSISENRVNEYVPYEYVGNSPSPSTKRAMCIMEKARKKIRSNKEDSIDEEMKNSSEEEK